MLQGGLLPFVNAQRYRPSLIGQLLAKEGFPLFTDTGFVSTSKVFADSAFDSDIPGFRFRPSPRTCTCSEKDHPAGLRFEHNDTLRMELPEDDSPLEVPANSSAAGSRIEPGITNIVSKANSSVFRIQAIHFFRGALLMCWELLS
jgi:hypothetical protein